MQSYTGSDIIEIDGRVYSNFADGDVATITYPNELSATKTGKNGNSIAVHNEMGRICELSLRLIKGSSDDKDMNSKFVAWQNRSESFSPMTALFTKVITVDGGITNEITSCRFGVPIKSVETKENVEGDTEQAVSVYSVRFGDSDRALA